MGSYIVGITGASGAIYARNMLRALLSLKHEVSLTITDPGFRVLREELSWELPQPRAADMVNAIKFYLGWEEDKDIPLRYFDHRDIGAEIASGSARNDGMIVIPCTVSTLSGIACGASENLVERAADIMLKEKRQLVLVPRETPLNQIHLKNMLELASMGAHIVPAAPAFYHKPETIEDLVNFVVGRVLDLLKIEHNLFKRWQGS
ncbi:UbiX family flavin prenyltransferase [Phosphitispora sp. TUW77]|uniref:UbiX family flavin prenyltransferase n=1 Tax=Phosphitispora sp. TUW77 TaxID=3152361 RepID=UPI003AB311C9